VLPVQGEQVTLMALATVNASRQDWFERNGRPDRSVVRGSYRRLADVQASWTDPDAGWLPRRGRPHLGYHSHYLVDGGSARIILDVLVTPPDVTDDQPLTDLLWRSRFRHRLWPQLVCGDGAYGTTANLVALETAQIRAYFPLPTTTPQRSHYPKGVFTYVAAEDVYRCPEGQVLRRVGEDRAEGVVHYRAEAALCNACPAKAACTPSPRGRSVQRAEAEEFVAQVRAYAETAAYQRALRKRQVWVEPLFGESKQWHRLRRFRLRGLERVTTEALLTAAGQNLKRLVAGRRWQPRPWPTSPAGYGTAGQPDGDRTAARLLSPASTALLFQQADAVRSYDLQTS
jgi:hypothetical protein